MLWKADINYVTILGQKLWHATSTISKKKNADLREKARVYLLKRSYEQYFEIDLVSKWHLGYAGSRVLIWFLGNPERMTRFDR